MKNTSKLALICLSIIFFSAFNSKGYDHHLQIKNSQKNLVNNFTVSIADTDEKRSHGLMNVKNMPENYGMLFNFDSEQMIFMWMKNTKIPLDMIFIDKTGTVVHIKHNAKVESLDVISSEKLAKQVLEINGGLADRLKINIGDKVTYTK